MVVSHLTRQWKVTYHRHMNKTHRINAEDLRVGDVIEFLNKPYVVEEIVSRTGPSADVFFASAKAANDRGISLARGGWISVYSAAVLREAAA